MIFTLNFLFNRQRKEIEDLLKKQQVEFQEILLEQFKNKSQKWRRKKIE